MGLRARLAAFAPLSTKKRDRMSSREFAYVDPEGTTHLPINDAVHAARARGRFNQTVFHSESAAREAWRKILAAEKRFGIKSKDGDAMPQPRIRKKPVASSAAPAGRIALCNAVELTGDEPPEWIELVPAGTFRTNDGRGPFENPDPAKVVEMSCAAMKGGIPIDYDHATDRAAPNGLPAPAAGWIREFRVVAGAIQGRVEWTENGARSIKSKEYRFISPVFSYDPPAGASQDEETGRVKLIARAALTNNPALSQLPAIAASREAQMANDTGAMSLSKVIQKLEQAFPDMPQAKLLKLAQEALVNDGDGDPTDVIPPTDDDPEAAAAADPDGDGMGADPNDGESEDEMMARHREEMARCANDSERAEMAKKHQSERAKRDEARAGRRVNREREAHHSAKSVLTHPLFVGMRRMVGSLQREVTQMRASQSADAAKNTVDSAIADGRILPAQRAWATAYCAADPKGFADFIALQPKIISAGSDGTITARPHDAKGDDYLSADEIAICSQFHVKPEDFLARRKTVAAAMVARPSGALVKFTVETPGAGARA